MTDLNIEVIYFENGGPHNTDKALEIAKKYVNKFDIKDIVIASTTGKTASKALEYFNPKRYNIVVITHSYYFAGVTNRQEFPEDLRKNLKEQGLKVFTATHSMAGIERSLRKSLNQWSPVEILAKYLRTNFSQGVKVCMEISSMAVDAGLIDDIERDIISIGGTGRGADTVCLIKPMPTSLFDQLRVKAILAKPL
ncbi:MAG: pyruvate kinase alpha/beta domain-containing protein [Promethearchaeota archaeon]